MLAIHVDFLQGMDRLGKSDRARASDLVKHLAKGQVTPGQRRHRVGDFVSFSPSMGIRALAVDTDSGLVLVHVGHHDSAYAWGQRHRAVVQGGELVAVMPSLSDATSPQQSEAPAQLELLPLLEAGLPKQIAQVLASAATDDERMELILALAPEYQEAAFETTSQLRSGARAMTMAVLDHSRADLLWSNLQAHQRPSDIVVLDDDRALDFALALPGQAWRVFLHPKQRFAVEFPLSRHVFLRGGPGTGKSVVIAHRFARLYRDWVGKRAGPPPMLLVAHATAAEVLISTIEALGISRVRDYLRVAGYDIRPDLVERRASTILVDEGQDLSVGNVAGVLVSWIQVSTCRHSSSLWMRTSPS